MSDKNWKHKTESIPYGKVVLQEQIEKTYLNT